MENNSSNNEKTRLMNLLSTADLRRCSTLNGLTRSGLHFVLMESIVIVVKSCVS